MENLEDLYPDLDELYGDTSEEKKEQNTPKTPSRRNPTILQAAKELKKDADKLGTTKEKIKNAIPFEVEFVLPKTKKKKKAEDTPVTVTSLIKDKQKKDRAERRAEMKADLEELNRKLELQRQKELREKRRLIEQKKEQQKLKKLENARKRNAREATKAFGDYKRELKKKEELAVIQSMINSNGKLSTTDPDRIKRKELIGEKFKIYNIISSRLLSNKDGNLNVEINPDSFTPSLDEVARNKGVLISKGSYKDGMKQIIRPQKSTAVKSVTYDPKTNTAWLTFVGGNKQYAYNVTPYELELFANAGSKGRWVNKVWKIHNRKEDY